MIGEEPLVFTKKNQLSGDAASPNQWRRVHNVHWFSEHPSFHQQIKKKILKKNFFEKNFRKKNFLREIFVITRTKKREKIVTAMQPTLHATLVLAKN